MNYDNEVNATSLLISCREGDPAALDELVRRCQPVIERLALTLLDDGRPDPLPEVRAVVQETLIASLGTVETFRDEAGFITWIYGLGLKACRKRLRPRAPRKPAPEKPALAAVSAPAALAENTPAAAQAGVQLPVTGQRPSLSAAVQALDEDLRLPLLLHYANGLSVAQVAQVLKLSQSTVLARMNSGREKLLQR